MSTRAENPLKLRTARSVRFAVAVCVLASAPSAGTSSAAAEQIAGGSPASVAAARSPDGGGNYTQILCADPADGQGLGLGSLPEGLSNPASVEQWQIASSELDCTAGQQGAAGGVPLSVGQSNTYPQGTWAALLYQAPPTLTISAGTIYRAERAGGTNNGFMGIIQQGGNYEQLYSLPRNPTDQGDWFVGNVSERGSFSEPFSPQNAVELTVSPDATHWDVNATCDPNGNNDSACTLSAGEWEYRLFGGEIELHATQDPQVANVTGTLASAEPLTGVESLTFSATDSGPGVAYLRTILDGMTVQAQTVDGNDGHCVPVAGRDAYTWAYQVPCKTSLGGRSYSFDTSAVPDGRHQLELVLEDAAGNQSVVLDRTVTIDNASPVAGAPPDQGTGPLQPAGSANGSGASEAARLTLRTTRLSRSYRDSAVTLAGTLTGATGLPIGGAKLDVSEQIDAGEPETLTTATTKPDGSFEVSVPPGPSRTLEIGYRAFSQDSDYAARAALAETASAAVSLDVSPTHTSSSATITLSGSVLGPLPAHGVTVELLVHYRGAWEPFRDPQTGSHGHFRARYRFEGAVGRFPFRAKVIGEQSTFPYATGLSRVVDVQTR